MWLLMQGGHPEVAESLTEEGVCKLLSPNQIIQVMSLTSPAARRDLLLRHLSNRLTNLMHANSEPIDTIPVTSGELEVHRMEMWPTRGGPFELSSPSGMGPCAYGRAIVGTQDAVWQGLSVNTGHSIGQFQNLCPLKAVASIMPSPRGAAANSPEHSPDFLLLRSVVKNAIQLNWRALDHRSVASFRLICVARALKDFKGWLIDTAWSVLHQDCTSPFHILQICAGQGGEPITYRLNTVHSNIATKGELQFNPSLAKQMMNRCWSSEALKAPVLAVLVDRSSDKSTSRHSEGFLLGKGHSLTILHRKLMQIASLGQKVVYSEQNGVMSLNKDIRKSSITREDLQAAEQTFKWAASQLGMSKADWAPEPTSGRKTMIAQYGETQKTQALGLDFWIPHKEISGNHHRERDDSAEEETEVKNPLALEELPSYREEWRLWHDSLKGAKQLKGGKWAKFFVLHYIPMLERDAHRHQTTPHRALSFCSQFFNSWLLWQVDHQRLEPRQALEAMVSQVRKECFGARASKGPPWEQVHEAIQGALSPGHIKLLDETVHFGADPFFLDTLQGEGEWNNNQEQDEKLTLALLKDQLVETTALRGLCFDYEADRIKGLLLKAGVRVSPIVTAIKKTPHGEPVLDEEGDPKRRVCIHCSFGENAPNRTMHSAEHTRQKTTAPELLVLKILQEEKRYPNHEIRFARDDMASAFKHIALRLRKVGLFATTVLCFVLISLTFIFGGKPCPGGFDPLGDAILKATLAMSRPEESWALNGEQHPECGRFVDDLFSIIAMTGNRCGDHLRRLREIVVAIMGEEGLNYEKQTEEGTPTCFKYAFGVVLDAVDRLVMSQWSKVVKLFNLTIDFVNGTTEGLNLGTIESVTGIARNVLFSCPGNGLARIVLPRLEAAIKDAHRQFPQPKHIHPPAWCMPKSRLRGEDEAQGQENLRRALNLLLRLAVIEKGKLLRCPYEMALAPEIRMTWPGKEKEDTLVFMQMDASKEGLYLIDLATGRYIQEEFTPEEQELFNAFERGEDAVTINHRELLSELFGVVLLGPKHAGKLINLVNDNNAAEH